MNDWYRLCGPPASGTAVAFKCGVRVWRGRVDGVRCPNGRRMYEWSRHQWDIQLNVASWIAVICFFIGGAVVANLMFRI